VAIPRPVSVIGVVIPASPHQDRKPAWNTVVLGLPLAEHRDDESLRPGFLGLIPAGRSVPTCPTITATATNATIDFSVLIIEFYR
jgi:hypothetical protein